MDLKIAYLRIAIIFFLLLVSSVSILPPTKVLQKVVTDKIGPTAMTDDKALSQVTAKILIRITFHVTAFF